MIQLVMLDADNTIYGLDTSMAYKPVYEYLAKLTGKACGLVEEAHRELIDEVKAINDPKVRKYDYTFSRLSKKLDLDVGGKELYGVMKEALADAVIPNPGAKEALEQLKGEGRSLAVFTNSFPDLLKIKLGKAIPGWESLFDLVITPEETGEMKPSQKFYNIILGRLGFGYGEAVTVGDRWEADLKPAKELGITTVLVGGEKKGKPDFRIAGLAELPGIIREIEKK